MAEGRTTMMTPRAWRGKHGEDEACDYLRAQGLALVARNVRYRAGELDLVMRHGEVLVFVEVRVRGESRYGEAADSVGWRKRRRLIRAAQLFLQTLPATPRCRFDVVAIDERDGRRRLQWIRAAFEVA